MKIDLKEITVADLVADYQDNNDDGIFGYGGKLDIRPPYQREFIYKDKQRDAVIETVQRDFPLNTMYWALRDDGTYEVIDGQQRTISLCQYVAGDFAYMFKYFHNLTNDEKKQILDYKLMIYICSGKDSEKLEWFKIINIAGEQLSEQELRNAVYFGPWVSDAKRYFSKRDCVAYQLASDYLIGNPIRQDYLETAIKWISKDNIEGYMATHQDDSNSLALWQYFQNVITWLEGTFTIKRTKFMKGVDWGSLYNQFNSKVFNTKEIEDEVAKLIADDDVLKKKGIYPYVLTRDEQHLNIRNFSDSMKQKVYEKQKGLCNYCKNPFDISFMEGDHIIPWCDNGKTIEDNCQMLCKDCNRRKSGK